MGTCFEYHNSINQLDENSEIKPQNNYALAKNKLRIFIKKISVIIRILHGAGYSMFMERINQDILFMVNF